MQDEKLTAPLQDMGGVPRRRNAHDVGPVADPTTAEATRYLIVGTTGQGRAFRPSDWAERLAGVVELFVCERGSQTGAGRRQFASPIVHRGIKSLLIDAALLDACPDAFSFLSCFAAENDLTLSAYAQDRNAE